MSSSVIRATTNHPPKHNLKKKPFVFQCALFHLDRQKPILIGGRFVARLDKVLEMVDTLSVQMRHTPFAIFVIIEEESEKRKFDTIVKGLPPLV